MKKTLSFLLLLIALFNICAFSVFADTEDISTSITNNADGSTTYVHDNGTTTVVSAIEDVTQVGIQTRATYNKAGSVSAINYDNDTGAENWRYKLIGYFTYEEGVSCACTNATHEVTITNTEWQFSNGSNSWSGNAAYGFGNFKKYFLFITTGNIDVDLRICCDSYGNFY